MKYFIDTEFHEYKKKPLFSKAIDTIELISIGIVGEDNREYYAISKDFDLKEAWNSWQHGFKINVKPNEEVPCKEYWLRENVLKPIWRECLLESEQEWYAYSKNGSYERFVESLNKGEFDSLFTFKSFKKLINKYGKTNKQIAEEVKNFVYKETSQEIGVNSGDNLIPKDVRFYGYYADYDWVVFCWLFGRMIDLPKGFPKYCKDLKQMLDDKQEMRFGINMFKGNLANDIKKLPNYPKQTNEHNALADAKWNLELYNFIKSLN